MTLTGCDTTDPIGVGLAEEEQVNLDVAAYAAEATADDLDMMTSETDPVFGGAPFAAPPIGDLTVSRQVRFLDESGGEMDRYDAALTEAIEIDFSLEGSRSRTGDRGTVNIQVSRQRDVMVSGLLGDETERTWNGTGSASNNRSAVSDLAGNREYDFSASTLVEDVVIPVPRSWPLSGRITRQVTVTVVRGLEDTRIRERTVVVTFNGTNLVPIMVNGEQFTLNLETREIVDAAT